MRDSYPFWCLFWKKPRLFMVHRFPQRLINVGSIIVLYSQHHNFPIRHFAASPSCQSPWLPSTSECLVIRSCPIHDRPSFFFTAESGAGAFSFSTNQARYRFESASSWTLSRDGFMSHDRHRCGVTLVTLCFFFAKCYVSEWLEDGITPSNHILRSLVYHPPTSK